MHDGTVDDDDALVLARQVLEDEASALRRIAAALDTDFTDAMRLILRSSGRVVVMGVGKSGIVGKKIAATLASTGTPALFVHATEAFHGDLGMIGAGDVALLISQSGTTTETVRLIEPIRRIGATLIAMTGNLDSRLAMAAECVLATPVDREACPNNLAPTTSTTCAMAMGDALAVALMRARGFRAEHFAELHPGGALGHRMRRVADRMLTEDLPLCTPGTRMMSALARMTDSRLGMVVVLHDERIAGVLTDGDLRRALDAPHPDPDLLQQPVERYMNRSPVRIDPSATLGEAEEKLRLHRIKTLLVSADGARLDGLLDLYQL